MPEPLLNSSGKPCPQRAAWSHITGVALPAGVGFSMSLFITGLAFNNTTMVYQAKYGILTASLLSGTLGILLLRKAGITS